MGTMMIIGRQNLNASYSPEAAVAAEVDTFLYHARPGGGQIAHVRKVKWGGAESLFANLTGEGFSTPVIGYPLYVNGYFVTIELTNPFLLMAVKYSDATYSQCIGGIAENPTVAPAWQNNVVGWQSTHAGLVQKIFSCPLPLADAARIISNGPAGGTITGFATDDITTPDNKAGTPVYINHDGSNILVGGVNYRISYINEFNVGGVNTFGSLGAYWPFRNNPGMPPGLDFCYGGGDGPSSYFPVRVVTDGSFWYGFMMATATGAIWAWRNVKDDWFNPATFVYQNTGLVGNLVRNTFLPQIMNNTFKRRHFVVGTNRHRLYSSNVWPMTFDNFIDVDTTDGIIVSASYDPPYIYIIKKSGATFGHQLVKIYDSTLDSPRRRRKRGGEFWGVVPEVSTYMST